MEVKKIKKQLREYFDPLANELSLEGPKELSFSHTQFSLQYSNSRVGLEFSVDLSDFFIYALLFKVRDGNTTIGYQDESGVRQKKYIQEILKELSIDCEEETKKLQILGGDYKNCAKMALELSRLIKQNWDEIYDHYDHNTSPVQP